MISYAQLAQFEIREGSKAEPEYGSVSVAGMGEAELVAEGWTDGSVLLAEVAVYALFNGPTCVYVGQSSQLQIRLQQHRAFGRVFDHVLMRATSRECASGEEKRWIRALAPTDNVYHNGQARTKPESAPVEKIDLVALGLAKPKPLVRRPLVEPTITRRPL